MLWEISVIVKHLMKKTSNSPATLNFMKSTVRFWMPNRKCNRVFVVGANSSP